jgi:hypothetical protein
MTEITDRDGPKPAIVLEFDHNTEQFDEQIRVRFRAAHTELLVGESRTGESLLGIPLLIPAFATLGMACLKLCRKVGRAALDLDDYGHELLFRMDGENVLICSTMLRTTVTVKFDELFEAWRLFVEEVKRIVILKHPEKSTYPYWRLIDEDPDDFLTRLLTREDWFDERKDCFK